MDPLRIAVRALFVFLVLLVLVRVNGKRAVKHVSPFDFTLALILGDLVDDAIWAEVAMAQFVMASGVLIGAHVLMDYIRWCAGSVRA